MCMALAALRLGFLSRQIRNCLDLPGIPALLRQADRALHGLSSGMNNYQRSTVVELWERFARSHSLARRYRLERNVAGDLPIPLQAQQEEIWHDLRSVLSGIITGEQRLMAWFEIGDHLADMSSQVYLSQVGLPISARHWDYIYSGVDRLSSRERRIIEPFFCGGYNDNLHLASQLIGTYSGLCGLLEYAGDAILAIPKWDGTTISYRGRQTTIKRQHNSIIVPILDECERQVWPDTIILPNGLRGDVKQAIYHFNKLGVVRLSQDGNRLRW